MAGKPLTLSEWFKGRIAGPSFEMASLSGKTRLGATLTAEVAEVRLTLPDGRIVQFRAAATGGDAGFYLFKDFDDKDIDYRAGWIVLPDREQRGSIVVGGKPAIAHSGLNVAAMTAATPDRGNLQPERLTPANAARGFNCSPSCPKQ